MSEDPLDTLIAEVGRKRRVGKPLANTALEVLMERINSLDLATMDALAEVGLRAAQDAVANGVDHVSGPGEAKMPAFNNALRVARDGGTLESVSASDGADLVQVGFVTLVGEAIMETDGTN